MILLFEGQMSKIINEAFDGIKLKWIDIWIEWQIGFMITWGLTFESRAYITIDLPFLTIQIFLTR